MKTPRPVYVVRLRPKPAIGAGIRQLRAVLKSLLRRHGFVCVTLNREGDK